MIDLAPSLRNCSIGAAYHADGRTGTRFTDGDMPAYWRSGVTVRQDESHFCAGLRYQCHARTTETTVLQERLDPRRASCRIPQRNRMRPAPSAADTSGSRACARALRPYPPTPNLPHTSPTSSSVTTRHPSAANRPHSSPVGYV